MLSIQKQRFLELKSRPAKGVGRIEETIASVLKTYVHNPDIIDYLIPKILDYQKQDSESAELAPLKDQLADTKKRKKISLLSLSKKVIVDLSRNA